MASDDELSKQIIQILLSTHVDDDLYERVAKDIVVKVIKPHIEELLEGQAQAAYKGAYNVPSH